MTDQQFYQENLIKCLESIKADMDKLDTLITRSEAQAVVDRYLDKAKAIMVVIERDIEQINSIEIEEVTSTEGEATISYTDNETK